MEAIIAMGNLHMGHGGFASWLHLVHRVEPAYGAGLWLDLVSEARLV